MDAVNKHGGCELGCPHPYLIRISDICLAMIRLVSMQAAGGQMKNGEYLGEYLRGLIISDMPESDKAWLTRREKM
jgi:hypothetical protein